MTAAVSAPPVPSPEEARDNAAFLALMWALARPGTVHELPEPGVLPLALALVDLECRVMADDPDLAARIAETGARLTTAPMADHAFLAVADKALGVLAQLPAGTPLYPDHGATLVLPAVIGRGERLRPTGPGISGQAEIALGGLPPGFFDLRAERCSYPAGIEIVFVDGARIVALPRSTRVEVL